MGVSPGPSVPLKDLSPTEFSRISELLDESIELTPGEQNAWLAELERSDAKSAAVLRHLYASQGECYAKEFLETPNSIAGDLASMIEADAALVGKQFGPYRVLSLLGHGGMGNVWLAERVDGLFTRRVALKLVHRSLIGRMALERLTREREILASLDHPNIAQLDRCGVRGGLSTLSCARVRGRQAADDVLRRPSPLDCRAPGAVSTGLERSTVRACTSGDSPRLEALEHHGDRIRAGLPARLWDREASERRGGEGNRTHTAWRSSLNTRLLRT